MNLEFMLKPFDERAAEVRRLAKFDQRQRAVFDRIVDLVDREGVARLQAFVAQNAVRLGMNPAFKYLDIPHLLAAKLRYFVALDLDRSAPCRILDLGSGPGHFMFIAKCYGHQPLGLDMDNEIYLKMFELYDLERLDRTIVPGTPLELPHQFDLVTSIQTTFNRPVGRARLGRSTTFWTPAEWRWFFDEICAAMRFPGRIFFHLNPQLDPATGLRELDNLVALFTSNGGALDRERATVLFELERPLTFRG